VLQSEKAAAPAPAVGRNGTIMGGTPAAAPRPRVTPPVNMKPKPSNNPFFG
jgi:hypothetical protein